MQRLALLLSSYSYDISFCPTAAHSNAYGLSRLPTVESDLPAAFAEATAVNLAQLEALPLRTSEIRTATHGDQLLRKVLRYLKYRWPDKIPECLLPYWRRCYELTVEGKCVLWGLRVVVPTKLQSRVLAELHRGHPGVVRMKAVARSHVWWPKLDRAIEDQAKRCSSCQVNNHLPPKAPLHCWPCLSTPWVRIHVDYAGPVMGKMLLVVVDTHSKWPEVYIMNSSTSSRTITALRDIFARCGLPKQLVSDNGPQFVFEEFEQFLVANGINHIRSSLHHPSTNEAADGEASTEGRMRRGANPGAHVSNIIVAILHYTACDNRTSSKFLTARTSATYTPRPVVTNRPGHKRLKTGRGPINLDTHMREIIINQ